MKKIPIEQENQDLIDLAISIANDETIPVGVPSPAYARTPGTYFGAIKALKYLENVLVDNKRFKKALKQIAISTAPQIKVFANGEPCWPKAIAEKALKKD